MGINKKDLVYVALQFLLFAAYIPEISWMKLEIPSNVKELHLIFSILGIILVIISMLQLSNNLSPFPSPRKNGTLVTGGIFKYVRHPIYSGILVATFFFALYMHSGYKLLIFSFLLILFYFKSEYEEEKLLQKFKSYKEYRANTGRFLPRF